MRIFISTSSVKEITCFIFDRWGLRVGEFTGINGFWDGSSLSGKKVANGTYYYIVNYISINGKQGELSGFVQLIGTN